MCTWCKSVHAISQRTALPTPKHLDSDHAQRARRVRFPDVALHFRRQAAGVKNWTPIVTLPVQDVASREVIQLKKPLVWITLVG